MYLGEEGDQSVVEVLATEVSVASSGLDLQWKNQRCCIRNLVALDYFATRVRVDTDAVT